MASTNNYRVGKGKVYFKRAGATDYRDLGNAPTVEFTPEIEKLEHTSSREGVKSVDRTIVLSKKGTLRIVLEEWDRDNIALALLDDAYTGTGAIEIFGGNSVQGEVLIVDSNEVGTKYEWLFKNVEFIPAAALNLISDEWGQIEVEGTVQVDGTGSFGTVTEIVVT